MRSWLGTHRRRIATLVAVIAIATIGGHLSTAWPRTVALRFDLGPDFTALTEVRIAYIVDGEEVTGVRFQEPAERHVRHEVELAAGRYEIEAYLKGSAGIRLVHRALDVPAEGLVRVDLFDQGVAALE